MEPKDEEDRAYFKRIQIRQYYHSELKELLGIGSISTLNRDLAPHREALGPRHGHRWSFRQVLMMLKIFGVPYVIVG